MLGQLKAAGKRRKNDIIKNRNICRAFVNIKPVMRHANDIGEANELQRQG